jgi:raffinose/stachyose/melibiose transport system substrate-binding protein
MKKALVMLVVLALLGSMAFAAGGGEQAASGPVVLNVMGYGDNSNAEGISWNRMVTAFMEENPDVIIESELLYDEAYHQKVTARLAAGDVPHVAYMGADARWGAPWQEAGQQVDHSGAVDPAIYDFDLIPDMTGNGGFYYIPLGTSNITTVLFANEPLINELGFELPETYADLVAMVPAARAAGLEVVSIDGADGWAWGSCLMSTVVARMSGDPNFVSKSVAGDIPFTHPDWVRSLDFLATMVEDGVISQSSVLVDYGTNISNFSNEQALFMVQGQWAAGGVENPDVRNNMKQIPWPELPGEKGTAGSVAAAWQVGYGITKAGTEDPAVFDAAVRFLNYVNREAEATQRLRDGAIVAPVLAGYQVPADVPNEVAQKVTLAQSAQNTEVIDAHLSGAPNDALNAGMQQIVAGDATAEEIAAQVESLARQ